jgi:hypothetical protein
MVAAEDVKETILKDIPSAKLDAMELDLSSLDSVKKFIRVFYFDDLYKVLNHDVYAGYFMIFLSEL